MSGQHWVIVTTSEAMARQADVALAAICAANGGDDPPNLRAAYDLDPEAFAKLIEALVALGAQVDADLIQLAGLRPLDELLLVIHTRAQLVDTDHGARHRVNSESLTPTKAKGPNIMATITNVVLTDDLDGTEATGTIAFGLDGQAYEIDLHDPNAEAMRAGFARYIEVARKVAASQPARRGRKPGTTSRGGGGSTVPPASFRPPVASANGDRPLTADERAQLREWAAGRPDVKVAERGRIAASVVAEWRASTGRRS
jgi:hypothetical protein